MSTCAADAFSGCSTVYTSGPGRRLESTRWRPLRCTSVRPAHSRATRPPLPSGAPPSASSMRSTSAFRRDRRDRSGGASLPIAPEATRIPAVTEDCSSPTHPRLFGGSRRPQRPCGSGRAWRFARTTQTDHASRTGRSGRRLCGQGIPTRPPSRIVRKGRGRFAKGIATADAHRARWAARATSQPHPS
jgi:hypothetical protein